jgi:hypothetical protein
MAATEIKSKYLLKALASKPNIAEVIKYSPELRERIEGGISIEMGEMGEFNKPSHFFLGKTPTGLPWVHEKATIGILAMDTMTTLRLWNAAKMELMEKNPNLQGEELLRATARRTEEIVRRTNSVYEMKDRSAIGRSRSEIKRVLFRFSSQRNVIYNSLRRAILRYQITGNKTRLFKSLMLLTVVNSIMIAMIDRLRDAIYGREQEPWWKLLADIPVDVLKLQYGTNEVLSAIEGVVNYNKEFTANAPLFSALGSNGRDIILAFKDVISQTKYQEKNRKTGVQKNEPRWRHTAPKGIAAAINLVSQYYGVPIILKSIWNAPRMEPVRKGAGDQLDKVGIFDFN